MAIHLLDDLTSKNVISEGKTIRKLSDGGGLYLWVYADGKKYWRLRYWLNKVEKKPFAWLLSIGNSSKGTKTYHREPWQTRKKA